jgi:hypothetical protein
VPRNEERVSQRLVVEAGEEANTDYDACRSPEHRVIIVVFNSVQLRKWLEGISFFAGSFANSGRCGGSGHSECMLLVKYARYREEAWQSSRGRSSMLVRI